MNRTRAILARWLRRLLAGALITLLLAVPGPWIELWSGIDWRSGADWILPAADGDPEIQVIRSREVLAEKWYATDRPGGFGHVDLPDSPHIRHSTDDIPSWAALSPSQSPFGPGTAWISAFAGGAPLRAASFHEILGLDAQLVPASVLVDGFDFGSLALGAATARVIVPTRVLWRGAILDTLFWALVWSGTAGLVRTARRQYRLRRNQCPNCAYDLRGAPTDRCSECGERVPQAGRPAAAANAATKSDSL